MDVKLDLLH